jgi:pimeloyl-ACP methyl ester carboxylesterase
MARQQVLHFQAVGFLRWVWTWLRRSLLVALGVLAGLVYHFWPPPVVLGADSIPPLLTASDLASNANLVQVSRRGQGLMLINDGYILARPSSPNNTVFVLYPGGLVPPQAYEFIARALATRGFTVAIPVMPLNLAVFSPDRAATVRDDLQRTGIQIERFVVGGHSLGGAMAARFALNNPVDGLVLMASFSAETDDLSGQKLAVLNLAAELDGLATKDTVNDGLKRLPKGTTVAVLKGGVHAFFGRYGPQAGDGIPTTTRENFERELLPLLGNFLNKITVR